MAKIKFITCAQAVELSKKVGTRIHWRPDCVMNRQDPDSDVAEVVEQ